MKKYIFKLAILFIAFINNLIHCSDLNNKKDLNTKDLKTTENKNITKKKKHSKFEKYISYSLYYASTYSFFSYLTSLFFLKSDHSKITINAAISGGLVGLIMKYIPKKYRSGVFSLGLFLPIFLVLGSFSNKK